MLAAERGADYVMFGEPDENNERPSLEAVLDRVAWWAEVLEIPCVAYAANAGEVAPLVEAGADFVAIGDFIFSDPRGVATAVFWRGALLLRIQPKHFELPFPFCRSIAQQA